MPTRRSVLLPLSLALSTALSCGPAATPAPKAGTPGEAKPDAPLPVPQATLDLKVKRAAPAGEGKASPVLTALDKEMTRYKATFAKQKEPRPYFLGYQVIERQAVEIEAVSGAITREHKEHRRVLGVEVRVGDYGLDNTNPAAGYGMGWGGSWLLPLEDDVAKLRPTIWLATERSQRQTREAFAEVKAKIAVKAKEEEQSPDFSREEPLVRIMPTATVKVDMAAWKARLRRLAAPLAANPGVYFSQVKLMVSADNRYLLNSEGSRVQTGRTYARVGIMGHTRAEDGMDLVRSETVDASSLDGLAAEEAIAARVKQVIDDLAALRKAPLSDPYIGPAILEGRAAGVYFHEIFGHRVEGHRQKGHIEGQTFAKQVGKQVLPPFIDVYDDPTIAGLAGVELNGFYRVDDEGVMAQRASLVEGGVLKGFLMSRNPARGFNRSNGHGRRQEGRPVVARQGNLIVHPSKVTTPEALKVRLLQEVKRQGKPYGLRFTVVEGGFTNTSRYGAQFFKVKPVMVYRIYPDGREELVRGADIEGTPLTSISQVQLAANDMVVFNGYCGAESGMVPVSAASPSLLVSKVEIARRMTGKERPPILPAPPMKKGGAK